MIDVDNYTTRSFFSEEEMTNMLPDSLDSTEDKPVTVLGITFENDAKRREYFREELRKKLPELRNIEGFPIGSDDDIINLSDPPYYTACPNPWLNDFIAQWEEEKKELVKQGKREEEFEVKEPYASDVSEGKYDPLYLYHSYLTKVPPKAIEKYICHYTQCGDIVFDGFSGTGMTAAAARMTNRKAICSDLSPLASFIAYCVNSSVSSAQFSQRASSLIDEVYNKLGWMFETKHTNGDLGTINYVLWSDVFTCPTCGKEVVFWHDGVDIEAGKVRDIITCKSCSSTFTKKQLSKKTETIYDSIINDSITIQSRKAVLINYTYNGKRYEKELDEEDVKRIEQISSYNIPEWVPQDEVYKGDKTDEAINHKILHFYQFYTKRVLCVLAMLKSKIDEPIYNYLITKLSFQSTLMYRYTYMNGCWGAGGGPMSGTMYIPSLIKEINIFKQLKDAINSRVKLTIPQDMTCTCLGVQSIVDFKNLQPNSIDYIFTDPPFGSNLMYSEMNYLSEMWLKVKTNSSTECIVNKSQKKNISEYQSLMHNAFVAYYKVLKPGRWMSVEFSNTSSSVWNSIQNAITQSGFVIANVASLDKQKGSYNAVNSTTAVKQDLVITCYKPSDELTDKMVNYSKSADNVWDFINEYLLHLPVHIERNNATTTVIERSPKILFDRLISYYVVKGYLVPLDAADFQAGLRERYIERDGMFFTATQAAEYDEKKKLAPEFVPMGIIVSDEANGIQWLKNQLQSGAKTYQEIQPEWMQAINGTRKNDIIPELKQLLEENFIEEDGGKWRLPNIQDDKDVNALRTKSLLREFKIYVETAQKPKGKIKEARVEALRTGFKQCYIDKDFQTIVTVGDKIPQNLLTEDEVLLQFYDIAQNKL